VCIRSKADNSVVTFSSTSRCVGLQDKRAWSACIADVVATPAILRQTANLHRSWNACKCACLSVLVCLPALLPHGAAMADGDSVVQYVEGAKKQAQAIGSKVEQYLRSKKSFQTACSQAFASVDVRGTGKITLDQAAAACCEFFKDISASLDDFGRVNLLPCMHACPTTTCQGCQQQEAAPAAMQPSILNATSAPDRHAAACPAGIKVTEPSTSEVKKILKVGHQQQLPGCLNRSGRGIHILECIAGGCCSRRHGTPQGLPARGGSLKNCLKQTPTSACCTGHDPHSGVGHNRDH
jgi:hypothetical protein